MLIRRPDTPLVNAGEILSAMIVPSSIARLDPFENIVWQALSSQ